jgi:filamentous hemagglutinin
MSPLDTPSISLSYGSSKSDSPSNISSSANSGSTTPGSGNVTLVTRGGALKDANGNPLDDVITVTGSTITAGAAATFAANHNVTFQASTDSHNGVLSRAVPAWGFRLRRRTLADLSRGVQSGSNSGRVSASPYNASSGSANGNSTSTQQTATVVTGNSVVVTSHTGDINAIGSGISSTQAVSLIAAQRSTYRPAPEG